MTRGCTPRVPCAEKVTVTAQMDVAAGKIVRDRMGDLRVMSAGAGDCDGPHALVSDTKT